MKQVTLFVLVLMTHSLLAQMIPVPFERRVKNADCIALARPTEQQSYWDADHANIWTRTVFEVRAYVKGANSQQFIATISPGGVVDNESQVTCPTESFNKNMDYLLILEANNTQIDDKKYRDLSPDVPQRRVYASFQGTLPYDGHFYYDGMAELQMSEADLFNRLKTMYGLAATTPDGAPYAIRKSATLLPPSGTITSITDGSGSLPATGFVAGTIAAANELIINGTGFGATAGTVQFKTADNGSATSFISTLTSDIIAWSATQIRVKIPTSGATGTLNVLDNTAALVASTTITIKWAEINVESSSIGFSSSTRQQNHLSNRNGSGGYSFQYSSQTSGGSTFSTDIPAQTAFLRSLSTWRCNTLVNYGISGTTSAGYANDNISSVMYDNTLSDGALGVCTYRSSAPGSATCTLYTTTWYLKEMDIQIRPIPSTGFTWNFTTGAPSGTQYDFESVMSHEIGHGHGLGHINNSALMMHYVIFNGSAKRTPSANEIAAGSYKVAQSTATNCVTSILPMTTISAASCTVLPIELLDFSGKQAKSDVKLTWITASERDNKGFELERSSDGKTFAAIGFVKGQGTTTQQHTYDFTDTPPQYFGGIVYYRLRQINFDGTESLSKTLSFTLGKATDWLVFPNPTKTDVVVQSNQDIKGTVIVEWADLLGRTLGSSIYEGISVKSGIHQNVENLPNGLYFIKILSDNTVLFTQRVVKN